MTTKMTKKGQILIPVEFRRRYRLGPGAKLELMDVGGELVIIPMMVKNPIDGARGLLKGGRSTSELMKLARQEERRLERRKK